METGTPTAAEDTLFVDVEAIRREFPVLQQEFHGKPLTYLDNAATTQKPQVVIDRLRRYYEQENANVHRAVYSLGELASQAFEDSRKTVRKFLNAASEKEIIFTGGTTDAINLVAATFGRANLGPGDDVIISAMEHHSNIVPWQMICEEKGATLKVIPIDDRGDLIFEQFENLLSERTKLVSLVYISNSLGTINPVKKVIELAHAHGVPVLLDGAQAVAHMPVDVRELDCDFFAFSGHKVFGPTGIGVLYGKEKLLDAMPPYRGGGDMILSVTFEKTTYNDLPFKFEAGTPNIAGAIGLGAALDYISSLGFDRITAHEHKLLEYATEHLQAIDGLRIIGTAREKAGVISFVLDNAHPHDVGTILDREGIAIRTGHHCTQPVMERYCVPATSRASFSVYNTFEDFDRLVQGIRKVQEVFG